MPVIKFSPVRKADKPAQVAIYNANGKVIGICDPDDITPVADPSGSEPDLTPMPAGDVGTPADGIAKQRRAAEVRKGLYQGGTAASRNQLADDLNRAAMLGLRIIHGRTAA